MAEKLRPCPLCHADRLERIDGQARCGGCGCRLEFDVDGRRVRVAYLPRRFAHLETALLDHWFTRRELQEAVRPARDAEPSDEVDEIDEIDEPGDSEAPATGVPTLPLIAAVAMLVVVCLCVALLAGAAFGYVVSARGIEERQAATAGAAAAGAATAATPADSAEFGPGAALQTPEGAAAGESIDAVAPSVPAAPSDGGFAGEAPDRIVPPTLTPSPAAPAAPRAPPPAEPPPTPAPNPALDSPLPPPTPAPDAAPPTEVRPEPQLPPTFTPAPENPPNAPPPTESAPTATPPPPVAPATNTPLPPTNTPGPAPTPTPTYAPGGKTEGGVEIVINYNDDQVKLTNIGSEVVQLTDLHLRALVPGRAANDPALRFDFPNGATIIINGTCTVYVVNYSPTDQCPFDWGSAAGVLWPDTPGKGVTVLLVDANGRELARYTY